MLYNITRCKQYIEQNREYVPCDEKDDPFYMLLLESCQGKELIDWFESPD